MRGGSCQRASLVCMNNKELHLKNGFIICLLRLPSFIPKLLQCVHAASPLCLLPMQDAVFHARDSWQFIPFVCVIMPSGVAFELPFKQSCDQQGGLGCWYLPFLHSLVEKGCGPACSLFGRLLFCSRKTVCRVTKVTDGTNYLDNGVDAAEKYAASRLIPEDAPALKLLPSQHHSGFSRLLSITVPECCVYSLNWRPLGKLHLLYLIP